MGCIGFVLLVFEFCGLYCFCAGVYCFRVAGVWILWVMATVSVKLVCIVRSHLQEKQIYSIFGFKVYHAFVNKNPEDV